MQEVVPDPVAQVMRPKQRLVPLGTHAGFWSVQTDPEHEEPLRHSSESAMPKAAQVDSCSQRPEVPQQALWAPFRTEVQGGHSSSVHAEERVVAGQSRPDPCLGVVTMNVLVNIP